QKEILRCNQIINYFIENPKSNPLVVTISLINSYFTQLLMYHGLKDKSKMNVAKSLRVSPYFVEDYIKAGKNYPMRKVSQIISLLRDADVKSKGVGANLSDRDVLKELMFKILH
ncbi:MAG: DNA polymerase III subunit delta, partial [Wenyingzhuangia sp.]